MTTLYALLWSPSVREFLAMQRAALGKGGTGNDPGDAPKYESG